MRKLVFLYPELLTLHYVCTEDAQLVKRTASSSVPVEEGPKTESCHSRVAQLKSQRNPGWREERRLEMRFIVAEMATNQV